MAFNLTPPEPRPPRRSSFRLRPPKFELSENDVERQINDYLRWHGWRLHRLHVGKARFPSGHWVEFYPQGTADWMATRGRQGAVLYYEVKRPGEKPSADQVVFLEQARREGYPADWFDSLAAFVAWYKALGLAG
jgi:hypothetical protein